MSDGSSLVADRSFWGVITTQFLGAFNDNVFKQVVLLLFVAVPRPDGTTMDLQSLALLVFASPFVLFSGFAGYIADRNSKRRVFLACKFAELVIMVVGIGAFAAYSGAGLSVLVISGLAAILFLMGMQSAFFGPSKLGILPELFHERHLPVANGMMLMSTFVAIILGSALAGVLTQFQGHRLWVVGVVCSGIAVVGIGTALTVRRLSAADPRLRFQVGSLAIPSEIRELFASDRALLSAALVSAVFWMTAAIVQPAVNSLGKNQLGESDSRTSLLVTMISVGIAIGSLLAGWLSKNRIDWRLLKLGAAGIVATLIALSLATQGEHWLGYWGSMVALIILGAFTGMFAVPLQVFLQSRPPLALKGRMMATQNLLNWIGILLSALIYIGMGKITKANAWPHSFVFAMTALLMVPVVVFYRPQNGSRTAAA